MKSVITDQGTEYLNETIQELFKLLDMKHSTSSSYHHQTLGICERSHRTFNEYIRSYINSQKDDWDNWLKYFTYCFNTTPSTTHGYRPYELIFGKSPTTFQFLLSNNVDPIYNIDAYDKEIKFKLQTAYQRTKQILEKRKSESKHNYDKDAKPQELKKNDMVLLTNEQRHKFEPIFKGPYKIKNIVEPNVVLAEEKNMSNSITVHKNRVKKFNKLFNYRFNV